MVTKSGTLEFVLMDRWTDRRLFNDIYQQQRLFSVECCDWMVFLGELERIGKEVVATYFTVFFRRSSGGSEETHENLSIISVAFELGTFPIRLFLCGHCLSVKKFPRSEYRLCNLKFWSQLIYS
jgi:hypothetical protein